MKIATWNVNGIRARAAQVCEFLEREKPDVLCLQELKAGIDQVPEQCKTDNYHVYWHGSTLRVKKDQIDPTITAVGGVLSEYIPQLEYGKTADPAATIAEMRKKLKEAGFEDALKSIQADLDTWSKTHQAK